MSAGSYNQSLYENIRRINHDLGDANESLKRLTLNIISLQTTQHELFEQLRRKDESFYHSPPKIHLEVISDLHVGLLPDKCLNKVIGTNISDLTQLFQAAVVYQTKIQNENDRLQQALDFYP